MKANEDQSKIQSNLPVNQYSLRVASQFENLEKFLRFLGVYRVLVKSDAVLIEHMQRMANGECYKRLIEKLYLDLPFPAPVVVAPSVRYAANGRELVAIAKKFNNCLQGFVAAGLHGEVQYYVWEKIGARPVVFEIANDAPFGWYLADCYSLGEARVSKDVRKELEDILCRSGVRSGGSMAWLMRPFRRKLTEHDVVTFPNGGAGIR